MKLQCLILVGMLASALACGCSKPRTIDEIEAERRSLPVLYLTEETLKRVEAPADAGLFVDQETGEICYRAYECTNPDCPGRDADGKPHLFIHRDVLVSANAAGEFAWEPIPAGQDPQDYIRSKGGHMSPTCDKCFEIRDIDNESDEQKRQYQQWAELHELPATAQRLAALEVEYQKAFQAREALRSGEGS